MHPSLVFATLATAADAALVAPPGIALAEQTAEVTFREYVPGRGLRYCSWNGLHQNSIDDIGMPVSHDAGPESVDACRNAEMRAREGGQPARRYGAA